MRRFLRSMCLCIFLLALLLPSPAFTQAGSEGLSEAALSSVSDLQARAQQLAQQQGQFAGRSVGNQFASATNQLLQVLTNFDIWACGMTITALHLKRQQLTIAAAVEDDPALDQAVTDFGNLIAELQELCNRHVFGEGNEATGLEGDRTGGDATPPTVEEPPPPPTTTVQERICYNRCIDLYAAYLRAERLYNRRRQWAEEARQDATAKRQEADRAAEEARARRQTAEESQREFDRLTAAVAAARTQAERLQIVDQRLKVDPKAKRKEADEAEQTAEEAAREAQEAEDRAARGEARARVLYDAMIEIYEAWLRCARDCAEQVRLYEGITVDLHRVFPGIGRSPPPRPPLYRAPPAPERQEEQQQQSSLPLDAASARMLAMHNAERAAVGVPPLHWDAALQAAATGWAVQLARTGRLAHAPREGRGITRENLSQGMIGWSPEQMMASWVREKSDFYAGVYPNVTRTGRWQDVSHYTQMIWPTTTHVGCGIATGSGYQWLVCRYSPGGNKEGHRVGVARRPM